jgi:hypothetical protein
MIRRFFNWLFTETPPSDSDECVICRGTILAYMQGMTDDPVPPHSCKEIGGKTEVDK